MSFLSAAPSLDAAVILANWTFETTAPTTAGPHQAEEGVHAAQSSAIRFNASGSASYTSPAGNGSDESFNSNHWAAGDYYEVSVPTTGHSGITLSLDHISSNTGPADFIVEYSADGVSFTTGASYSVTSASWSSSSTHGPSSRTFDFSAVAELDDQDTIWFRVSVAPDSLAVNEGSIATTGTSRVDNIRIAAAPEPSVALLGALGMLGILRRRR